jgi:hypothetical protein
MANQFSEFKSGSVGGGLSSPMGSRPSVAPTPGAGGNQPGDKDGVEFLKGAAAGQLSSPMTSAPATQPGVSTAGGPVGLQVTESVQDIVNKRGSFPTGTSTKV